MSAMKGTVNCRWTEARLLAFADGELTAREAGLVAAHLEVCPACRELAEALARRDAVLTESFGGGTGLPAGWPGPAPDFTDRVMDGIRQRQVQIAAAEDRRRAGAREDSGRMWAAWARPLAAAGLVATLLLGSYTALTLDSRSYLRIIAYEQKTAIGIRDGFWTVARVTGLDGLITRYLTQIGQQSPE